MKHIFFIGLFSWTMTFVQLAFVRAEPRGGQPLDSNPWFEQGNLFSLKIVPKDRSLQIFVVGHQVHSFRPDDIDIEAYIVSGDRQQSIPVERKNGAFVVTPPEKDADLRVKMRHSTEEEEEIRLRRPK